MKQNFIMPTLVGLSIPPLSLSTCKAFPKNKQKGFNQQTEKNNQISTSKSSVSEASDSFMEIINEEKTSNLEDNKERISGNE